MYYFTTLIVLLGIFSTTSGTDMYDDDTSIVQQEEIIEQPCGENEVWMDCPSCEEKCGHRPTSPCPRICQKPRCHCAAHKGYRRDENGKCVFCHGPKFEPRVFSH